MDLVQCIDRLVLPFGALRFSRWQSQSGMITDADLIVNVTKCSIVHAVNCWVQLVTSNPNVLAMHY